MDDSTITPMTYPPSNTFKWFISTFWQYFFRSLYFLVPIAGIFLNCYVLFRLRKIAKISAYRFETSSALPLCAMSICDSVCLASQFSQAVFHMIVNFHDSVDQNYSKTILMQLSFFCKIDLYLIHSTSAFSVWCWFCLSVLRYTAVFHPFKYRTIWRQPRHALVTMALISCVFETWIPFMVSYLPNDQSCNENPEINQFTFQMAHMMDILFAYVVPSFARILLDGIVLSHCYRPNLIEIHIFERRCGISAASGDSTTIITNEEKLNILTLPRQSIFYKREQYARKKNSMIVRSLIISAINLCCNLPSHIFRAFWTIEPSHQMNDTLMIFLEGISQLLYFGQFTCNAFYLSTTIYETSTAPSTKTISTAHLSKMNVSRLLENEDL